MNYSKHYKLLIESRKNRSISPGVYYETHHIVPRCMGGVDSPDNLIKLLPEEHYTAHLLLAKIYPSNEKLWYSCVMMSSGLTGRKNKCYSFVRIRASSAHSIDVKDRWAKKYGFVDYQNQCQVIWDMYINLNIPNIKISKILNMYITNVLSSLNFYAKTTHQIDILKNKRRYYKSIASKETRNNITPEQEMNRILSVKNADYSNRKGTRIGMLNPVYGKTWNFNKTICPYCNKSTASKRWHFNNCRNKENED